MATAYILLHATISCPWEALIGLLNTLIPALLAWLAARSYFKVAEKDQEVKTLTVLRNELDGKMGGLNADLTNVRLSLSKAEAELEDKAQRISHLRNELIIAENDRTLLRDHIGHEAADAILNAGVTQPVEFDGVFYAANDFNMFSGVNSELNAKLKGAGYKTWADLANADDSALGLLLAGTGLSAADLKAQARFAADGNWKGLKEYQSGVVIDRGGDARNPEFVEFNGRRWRYNDLDIVEGIGPKVAELLNNAGINTWDELCKTSPERIREILTAAGSAYSMHDPGTWPNQACLAAAGDWNALQTLQDQLIGGRGMVAEREPVTIEFNGITYRINDLRIVEGIGPKIAGLLNDAGINTWDELCKTSPERIKEILNNAGSEYSMHDPSSWPNQACLAAAGSWDALLQLQDELVGGVDVTSRSPRNPESVEFGGKKYIWDDLKIVEGIGPKIEELLHNAGINTWKRLSVSYPDRIKEILNEAGPNFAMHDPGTWPDQAALAYEQRWSDLQVMQDALNAGK